VLNCSNLPVGAKCTFNPPTIMNGGTSTLTVSTNNQTASSRRPDSQVYAVWLASLLMPVGIVVAVTTLRRKPVWMWMTLMIVAAVLVLVACGSEGSASISNGSSNLPLPGTPKPGNTPSGTYAIGINAGNGPALATTSVTLTVK
jgi:hypothetical protein